MTSAARRPAALAQQEPQPPAAAEVADESWYPDFADWLEREMPEGTVIGDPLWWASKIADRIIAADLPQRQHGQPEPEGLTDEQIMELMPQQMRDDLSHAARAIAGFNPANIKAAGAMRIILNRHAVDHARAVLARWGRPTPQPARLRYCPTHGQQPPQAWGCPECLRELREELAASLHPTPEATND